MIIIGSKAIRYWFPEFPREPKDIDIVRHYQEEKVKIKFNNVRIEYLTNPILANYCTRSVHNYLQPDLLYTLKVSHLFWDINWGKHLFDTQFLKEKGCTLDYNLFTALYNYWNSYHFVNKRSNLKMSSTDFFDNALPKTYSHDWLHTLIKETPTYTKILKDNAEVEVDEEKFYKLSEDDKEDLVREEIIVMAWERFRNLDYRVAWSKMIKKFIISHAPLWEAIWVIENFKKRKLYKPTYDFIKDLNNKTNGARTDSNFK